MLLHFDGTMKKNFIGKIIFIIQIRGSMIIQIRIE